MNVRQIGFVRDGIQAGRAFFDRGDTTFAASLAFYTSLSFGPMVMIMLAVTGAVDSRVQKGFVGQASALLGPEAGGVLDVVVKNVSIGTGGPFGTAFSVLLLLVSATAVFSQVQSTLNNIWEVQIKQGVRVMNWLRKRMISFGVLLALGFLLGVSLALNALVSSVLPGDGSFFGMVDAGISVIVFTLLFAVMYWLLPDAEVKLKMVWPGALVAAVLLTAAKHVIGVYLSRSAVATTYGTASTVLILLLWAFVAAALFFYGAEIVRAQTLRIEHELPPPESKLAKPADPTDTVARARV